MILPIVAYGHSVLKKVAVDVDINDPELPTLLENMWETMYNAEGVGIAAPQIGKSLRIFVIDASPFAEGESPEEAAVLKNFKKVFINAEIIEENGESWSFKEGCLSIPGVNEKISRKSEVTIKYLDENFKEQQETYTGLAARVIQHEYDHIEGVLFTDKISSLKKKLIQSKLTNISKGNIPQGYPMIFPSLKKRR